jgi:hypothetical protein
MSRQQADPVTVVALSAGLPFHPNPASSALTECVSPRQRSTKGRKAPAKQSAPSIQGLSRGLGSEGGVPWI